MLQDAIFVLVNARRRLRRRRGTRGLTGTWPGDEGQVPDEST
jgi:hypothetical protein